MKIIPIILALIVATLLVISVVLVFYNVEVEKSLKTIAAEKAKELKENMDSARQDIAEDLAITYKSQMDAFADVAKNLASIKQKERELEESARKKMSKKSKK